MQISNVQTELITAVQRSELPGISRIELAQATILQAPGFFVLLRTDPRLAELMETAKPLHYPYQICHNTKIGFGWLRGQLKSRRLVPYFCELLAASRPEAKGLVKPTGILNGQPVELVVPNAHFEAAHPARYVCHNPIGAIASHMVEPETEKQEPEIWRQAAWRTMLTRFPWANASVPRQSWLLVVHMRDVSWEEITTADLKAATQLSVGWNLWQLHSREQRKEVTQALGKALMNELFSIRRY